MNKLFKFSIASVFVFSIFLFAHAQSVSPRGSEQITFPIAELGNCASQVECKAYCNLAANITACTAYADSHHLITAEDKTRNQKFASAIKNGGPGGCSDFQTCKTYCDNQDHAAECLKFAQDNGLAPQGQTETTQNVNQALQTQGGPGGCKTQADCKTYCSNKDHQQECLDFGKKYGLVKTQDSSKIEKFQSLVAAGQTPGGCDSKDACETYCKDVSHKQECLDFAVNLGIISKDEASKIQQSGGKGPGGCDSKDSCDTYCNNQDHQQECLNFAQDHGSIDKGDAQNIQQGQASAQFGINNAPQQVQDCLKQILDADTLSQLENGQLTPSADVAAKIKSCFDQFKPQIKQGLQSKLQSDPQLQACIKQAAGADALAQLLAGKLPTDSTVSKKIRQCFGGQQEQGHNGQNATSTPQGAGGPASGGLKDCLVKILGADAVANLNTKNLTTEQKAAIAKCRPMGEGDQKGLGQNGSGTPPSPSNTDTAKIKQCIIAKLGTDGLQKLADPAYRNSSDGQSVLKTCGYPLPPQEGLGQNPNPNGQPQGQGPFSGQTQGQGPQGGINQQLPPPPQGTPHPPLGGDLEPSQGDNNQNQPAYQYQGH